MPFPVDQKEVRFSASFITRVKLLTLALACLHAGTASFVPAEGPVEVDALIEALNSGHHLSESLQKVDANAKALSTDPEFTAFLRDLIEGDEAKIHLLGKIVRYGHAVVPESHWDLIFQRLETADPAIEKALMRMVSDSRGPDSRVLAAFRRLLHHPLPDIRLEAELDLGGMHITDKDTCIEVIEMLNDPNPRVVEGARRAVKGIRSIDDEVLDHLIAHVKSGTEADHVAALEALGRLSDRSPRAEEFIVKTLSSPDVGMRRTASWLLGTTAKDRPHIIHRLAKLADVEHSETRRGARDALETAVQHGNLPAEERVAIKKALHERKFGALERRYWKRMALEARKPSCQQRVFRFLLDERSGPSRSAP